MSLQYRKDGRTVEEFQAAILYAARAEREIVDLYVEYCYRKFGVELDVIDNGVDNSGQLINGKVTSAADFIVDGRPLEVKYNKKMLDKFHLKVSQVNSYVKQSANILICNGWETENPLFTILKTHDLLFLQKGCEPISFWPCGGKLVYRLYTRDYNWKRLKGDANNERGIVH